MSFFCHKITQNVAQPIFCSNFYMTFTVDKSSQGDQNFRPMGYGLLWAVFLKVTEIARNFGLLFPKVLIL
jgi:hypothetical protein